MGQRDTMDRASQVVEPLGWPSARALGVDHPRLVLELVEPVGKACGGVAAGRHLRTAPRLCVEACWKAARNLARKTVRKAHTGKRKRGGVGTQREPSSAKAPRAPGSGGGQWALRVWSQVGRTMVAPSWPPRLRLATREERLADGAAQQREQEPFVGQDEGIEGVRHGKHGVEGGGRQQRGARRFDPLGRGPCLTCGTVAIAGMS